MRQSVYKNTTYSVILSIYFPLNLRHTLSTYYHSFCITIKSNTIFNDVPQLIINSYDVSLHVSLPPRKLSSISIEGWRSHIIVILIIRGNVVVVIMWHNLISTSIISTSITLISIHVFLSSSLL